MNHPAEVATLPLLGRGELHSLGKDFAWSMPAPDAKGPSSICEQRDNSPTLTQRVLHIFLPFGVSRVGSRPLAFIESLPIRHSSQWVDNLPTYP